MRATGRSALNSFPYTLDFFKSPSDGPHAAVVDRRLWYGTRRVSGVDSESLQLADPPHASGGDLRRAPVNLSGCPTAAAMDGAQPIQT